MKNVKAVVPGDLLIEVWKCLGERAVEFLMKQFNVTLDSEEMPEEWREVVLVINHKSDVQSCSNYRGVKLLSLQDLGKSRGNKAMRRTDDL